MKLTISLVTSWAAQMRSPSFSRSSSSATITSLPALMSAMACSTLPNGIGLMMQGEIQRLGIQRHAEVRCHQTLNVLRDHVRFDIDDIARTALREIRIPQGEVYERKLQSTGDELVDGEAHAVDRDGPVQNDQRLELRRDSKIDEECVARLPSGFDFRRAIDVTLDDMTPKPVSEPQRPLEIDAVPGFPT